ncbi:MAG: ferrous iron transport protein B [Prevotellaceae bacterium]|jgi:ferrous iron transport protein B|nr:ferrous iron transport protein B [Prevotellaceae bacterium]
MRLSDLSNGEKGVICKVLGRGAFRKRITEMGFVKGQVVTVVKNAPLKSPIEYAIMGYNVSLRRSEAGMVEVLTEEEAAQLDLAGATTATIDEVLMRTAQAAGSVINVAFVGNPNTGKTSLFNQLAGAHEHVGNYSGVTVELKKAQVKLDGYTINLVDLPGTYSLTAYSPEEVYVRRYIAEEMPDVIVNVVDATNLERNLYLTTQLIDMDVKVVMALNMYDELEAHGDRLDHAALGRMLDIPMAPTVGARGRGMRELLLAIVHSYEDTGLPRPTRGAAAPPRRPAPLAATAGAPHHHIHIYYGAAVEEAIAALQLLLRSPQNSALPDRYSTRFLAIKLLEKDAVAADIVQAECANAADILATAKRRIADVEAEFKEDSETVIADAKYGFVAGALRETLRHGREDRHSRTRKIDNLVTSRALGFPIFLLLMWGMFYATFALGRYPTEWISRGVELLSRGLAAALPPSLPADLLVSGVINGAGSVLAFLPNILLLFFFISYFEDSGYMARAVFITDKLMHAIGLHGKSFIPLIMGFGCNVPAIMATRTIENRTQRRLTMLLIPFMSCSARLPVYVLLIGAFFPRHAGTVLFAVYLAGIAIAILSGLLFSKFLFKDKGQPFVMELPPYRRPSFGTLARHTWHKGGQYLRKNGLTILVASVAIWGLSTFPLQPHGERAPYEQSYLGQLGHAVQPALAPLGFDGKMSISLLTGVAAKETVVSTLGVLYRAEVEDDGSTARLEQRLRAERHPSGPHRGQPVFTPPTALACIAFILLYLPCVAAVVAIRRESGSRLIAAFTVAYTTVVAWLAAFAVQRVAAALM